MAKPTIDQPNWGVTLNDHLDSMASDIDARETPAGAQAKADAAQAAAVAQVAADADDTGTDVGAAVSATIEAHPEVTGRIEVREAPLSPYRYGFVGDGTTDDTAALQATLDAATAGAMIDLPHTGNAKITAPLSITKAVTIRGHAGYSQRVYAVDCNAFEVAAGVDDVRLESFEIACATRHTTTANTLIGIKVDGTTGDKPTNHVYRDLYIDGFWTGMQTRYLWSSVFDNVRTSYGRIGLHAYGKSVNNFVHHCQFSVAAEDGSKGIALYGRESATDSTEIASEGWVISDTLTNGGECGIDLLSVNHVSIHDCILDFNTKWGVRAQTSATTFCTNYTIHDNYIAMTGADGAAAIYLTNAVDNAQRRWTRVHHNEILAYAGATCPYGIQASGAYAHSVIEGNTLRNFTTADITTGHAGSIVRGNVCLSGITNNIVATSGAEVSGNVGTVYRTGATDTSNYRRDALGRRVVNGPAAPTTGDWVRGERVVNELPAVGSAKAWVCTVSGSPGTWVSEGNL